MRVLIRLVLTGFVLVATTVALNGQSAPPSALIVIEKVTLIDGSGRAPLPNMTVVIDGERIASVTPGPTPAGIPATAKRIDGTGKFLIPGLMDMHMHTNIGGRGAAAGDPMKIGLRALQSYLYAGVTSIYDAGNDSDVILGLRDQERKGQVVAPRVFATGALITCPNGHGAGPTDSKSAVVIENWPADRVKLDAWVAKKPDVMKITYDEHGWGTRPMIKILSIPLLSELVDYAHRHGLMVTIHTSSEVRAVETLRVGIDSLAHPVVQGPVSDEFVQYMAAKKVPDVTTLTIGEGYSRLAEHPEFLDQPLYRDTFEPEIIQRMKTEGVAQQKQNRWAWWMKIMTPVCQENLRKQHAGGGILALGTDQSSGAAVHREMELLVAAGIKPLDVITIATKNAALVINRDRDLGTVEAGKLADLVLLKADPTVSIDNAKLIDTIIKGGQIVDRSKLDLPVNRRTTGGAGGR
jgi:imidazolonepropionase-like amidohydrolase